MSQAVKAAGKPVSWIPGLEEIAHYESGDNPYAVNDTPAGIAAGRPEGIMQMVMGTFLANHVPGTSDNIFDPIANIASSTTYIGRNYGSPEMTPGLIAVSQGKAYSYYDAGGSLPPGATLAVNATGSTEEVLTPAERAAWVALVKRMLSQPQGTSAGTAPNVTVQYIGTQVPSLETQAIMNRNLALALSGG
jgi:SLT domain-containing protein